MDLPSGNLVVSKGELQYRLILLPTYVYVYTIHGPIERTYV